MNPVRIDASAIKESVGETIDVTAEVELDPVDVSGVVYSPDNPATLNASLSNSGEGLLLHGTVAAVFDVDCSRCLSPFRYEITTDVDTLFVDEHADRGDDEQDVAVLQGDTIDISPIIESALRVEMPLAPACDEECAGICPQCGADLNESACTCSEDDVPEGPFAGLKDLLDAGDSQE